MISLLWILFVLRRGVFYLFGFCFVFPCYSISLFCNGLEWRKSSAIDIVSKTAWEWFRWQTDQDSSNACSHCSKCCKDTLVILFWYIHQYGHDYHQKKNCECAPLPLALEKFQTVHFLMFAKRVHTLQVFFFHLIAQPPQLQNFLNMYEFAWTDISSEVCICFYFPPVLRQHMFQTSPDNVFQWYSSVIFVVSFLV